MGRLLSILFVIYSTSAEAKMSTILASPKFDYNERETKSSITAMAGGVRIFTLYNFKTGCEFAVILETGTLVYRNPQCDDKYINEQVTRNTGP